MDKILSRWRSVTIGYLVIAYLLIVVFLHQPISTWLLASAGWILLLILVFLGTFIGMLGILFQSITKNPDTAKPFFKKAFKLGTKNAAILASYGLMLLRDNKSAEGLACFDRALTNSAYFLTTKTLMCNRGIALWKTGQLNQAIEAYMTALKKFGKDDQKYFSDRSFDEEALEALVKDNHYFYPQDYTTLGFLLTLKEAYDEAEFFSRAALIKEADYASAYDNLGQIEFYRGHLTEAKGHFDTALELNPSLSDSLYFSGLVAEQEGDTDTARNFLLKAKNCRLDGLNTIDYPMIDAALERLDD